MNTRIPPPPTHAPPTPPSEVVPISTNTQHDYANMSADIMRKKAMTAHTPLHADDSSVESSFRPGAGARFSKEPAVLPKGAQMIDHSRSSSMSSNVSSMFDSSSRVALHGAAMKRVSSRQ